MTFITDVVLDRKITGTQKSLNHFESAERNPELNAILLCLDYYDIELVSSQTQF